MKITFSEDSYYDGFLTVLWRMEGYSFEVTLNDGRVYEHLVVRDVAYDPHNEVQFLDYKKKGVIRLKADDIKEVKYL